MCLNAWTLIGLPKYKCFGSSEELDLRIRPNKELGPIWKIRPIMGLEVIWAFWIKDLDLGLGPVRKKVNLIFTLSMDH